jgi:hypothetical protein
MSFVHADGWTYGPHAEEIGVDTTKLPAFVIHRTNQEKGLVFDQGAPIKAGAVESFVENYLSQEQF